MGTSGMNYSLASRDIIADSMETVVNAQSYDGLIGVVGCDKNMPGAIIAMLRLNRPSLWCTEEQLLRENTKEEN